MVGKQGLEPLDPKSSASCHFAARPGCIDIIPGAEPVLVPHRCKVRKPAAVNRTVWYARLDALEAYHALLIRMNQTVAAEEMAKRIEVAKAAQGFGHFCGNGEMQKTNGSHGNPLCR